MHASQQTINKCNVLYAKLNARKATLPKFHVGDKVRIVRKKGTFEKGFTPNWTKEVFTAVKATKPPTYNVEDTMGQPVHGTIYEQEPQSSVQEICRIERVLKRGIDRVLVRWKDYNSAFNSWIPLADLEQLWISINSMIGSLAPTTVAKTILSFLEICEDLLLERVDVGRQRSSSNSCYNPTGWITITCMFSERVSTTRSTRCCKKDSKQAWASIRFPMCSLIKKRYV